MIKGLLRVFRDAFTWAIFIGGIVWLLAGYQTAAEVSVMLFTLVGFVSLIFRICRKIFGFLEGASKNHEEERRRKGPGFWAKFWANAASGSSGGSSGAVTCPNCRYGQVLYYYKNIMGQRTEGKKPCPNCHGTGRLRG